MAAHGNNNPNVFLLPDLGEGLEEAELLEWCVKEGQEVVSGNYHVISRELEDGKKVKKGLPGKSNVKENEPTTPD